MYIHIHTCMNNNMNVVIIAILYFITLLSLQPTHCLKDAASTPMSVPTPSGSRGRPASSGATRRVPETREQLAS